MANLFNYIWFLAHQKCLAYTHLPSSSAASNGPSIPVMHMQAAFRGGREARPACGVACMALLVPGEATAAVAHVIWPCGLSAACTRYLLYRLVGLFPVISAMTRARALYHLPCASRFVLLHVPMRFKIAVPLQFNTGPRAIAPCDTEVAVARRSRVQ